jgi:hypothetical protein
MSQLEEIRKEMRRRYLAKQWWPKFIDKFSTNLPIIQLQRYIRENYFSEPVNIGPDEYSSIPGFFRYRVKMDSSNLIPPEEPKKEFIQSKNVDIKYDYDAHMKYGSTDGFNQINDENNIMVDSDIKQVMEESLKDYEDNHENNYQTDLNKAMEASIIFNNDSLEDILLNQALIESLNNHGTIIKKIDKIFENKEEYNEVIINEIDKIFENEEEQNEEDCEEDCEEECDEEEYEEEIECDKEYEEEHEKEESFYVLIDMRVYGPKPKQPIYINAVQYFLNIEQIKEIENEWSKWNKETDQSIKYWLSLKSIDFKASLQSSIAEQNVEFINGQVNDMKTLDEL